MRLSSFLYFKYHYRSLFSEINQLEGWKWYLPWLTHVVLNKQLFVVTHQVQPWNRLSFHHEGPNIKHSQRCESKCCPIIVEWWEDGGQIVMVVETGGGERPDDGVECSWLLWKCVVDGIEYEVSSHLIKLKSILGIESVIVRANIGICICFQFMYI